MYDNKILVNDKVEVNIFKNYIYTENTYYDTK